ncbi:MAG: hypothetical protein ACIALR_07090 [Blastopirellula sp. JB062]
MNAIHSPLALVMLALLVGSGCGPRPVVGGTAGKLSTGGNPLSEMQVNVYRADRSNEAPLGFGVTAADGSFELMRPAAAGPLTLEPGQYRFTVESIGSPIRLPKKYSDAEKSPLTVDWQADQPLSLQIPGLRLPK